MYVFDLLCNPHVLTYVTTISFLHLSPNAHLPVFVLAALFQGLSLLLLNSTLCNDNTLIAQLQQDAANLGNNGLEFSDTCSISTGANCTIAAMVFWVVAAVTSRQGVVTEKLEEERSTATEPLIPGENL